MAKIKKPAKAKEPVRVRFKQLANGNQSIYLDVYKDGQRSYEFLRLYLVPEVTQADRVSNANTLQVANAIKAQRVIDITNGKAGISNNQSKAKMAFVDWMKEFNEAKRKSGRRWGTNIENTIKLLERYKGDKVTLAQADKAYFIGFFNFLNEYRTKAGEPLSPNTKYQYYLCVACAMNMAVTYDLISSNPIKKIPQENKPRKKETQRAYLTIDEVKAMISGRCGIEQVKRAFLFACFCGLRYGDVISLKWGQISKDGGQWRATIVMEKTQRPLVVPLSKEAMKWLPERGQAKDDDIVFVGMPAKVNVEKNLKGWAKACGIDKNITFHVSRHTFATMNITAGVDVYTTSKMLGHTDVKTTMIYAKIVDKKKDDAVNLVASLFE